MGLRAIFLMTYNICVYQGSIDKSNFKDWFTKFFNKNFRLLLVIHLKTNLR